MIFLDKNDISKASESAELALRDVRVELELPKSGNIVFPMFYNAMHCYHVVGKQASNLKKYGYLFALGILGVGGPHMYFLYKVMDSRMIDFLFGIQVLMFFFYIYKRHSILKKSKYLSLSKRPLLIYTKALGKYAPRSLLLKGIISFLVIFALCGGFFTYSILINGYYFLFLFMLGSLLWLSVGASIMALAIKAS